MLQVMEVNKLFSPYTIKTLGDFEDEKGTVVEKTLNGLFFGNKRITTRYQTLCSG